MADPLIFPGAQFLPRNVPLWRPASAAFDGGRPFTGAAPQRAAFSGGPLWGVRWGPVLVRTPAQYAALGALAARIDGGTRVLLVPKIDGVGVAAPGVIAAFSEAAALRATMVRLTVAGGALVANDHFGINHGGAIGERVYRVIDVPSGAPSGTVEIRPPLRAAVASGVAPKLHDLACVMRIADPAALTPEPNEAGHALMTLDFLESLS